MSLVSFLRKALLLLVPVALLLTTYLYTYPVFHLCAFPAPDDDSRSAYINTLRQHALPQSHDASAVAPFRLLALGDPQLEGDTSIDPDAFAFTALNKFLNDFLLRDGTKHNPLQWLRHCLHNLVDFYLDDIPKALEVYRKRLDHIGNDYYLGHQYRTLYWWANPTHVTVLGDLVGSQWIDDEEFETRGWRYWNRVFKHGQRVADEIASQPADDFEDTLILGEDAEFWKRRIINVAGNHDIGYAGDLTEHRMARFVRVFGKANYELRFQLPIDSKALNGTYGDLSDSVGETPELRIVILNDMNLDTPAVSQELQDETYNFLNKVITTSYDVGRRALFTLVLTHIPLYKEAGICVDGPLFDFHGDDVGGGIREQNHLSLDASKGFLEGIFGMSASKHADGGGMGRRGLIMNGHDHEGCDIYHYMNQSSSDEALNEYERRLSEDALAEFLLPTPEPPKWQAKRLRDAKSENLLTRSDIPGIQEATVRSMMGDFGGNAGLLSLWFDHASWEWKYEFVNCALGTQHIWWFVHIVDLIVAIIVLGWAFLELALQLQVTKPQSAKEPTNMNGYAKAGKKEIKVEEDSKIDPGVVEFVSGKLDSPGSGKLSLRKKSKLGLNGGITGNGPLYSI